MSTFQDYGSVIQIIILLLILRCVNRKTKPKPEEPRENPHPVDTKLWQLLRWARGEWHLVAWVREGSQRWEKGKAKGFALKDHLGNILEGTK